MPLQFAAYSSVVVQPAIGLFFIRPLDSDQEGVMKTLKIESQGVIVLWSSTFFVLFFILLAALHTPPGGVLSSQLYATLNDETQAWPPSVREFYETRDYEPVWVRDTRLTRLGTDLVEVLGQAEVEGLVTQDYLDESLLASIMQLAGDEPVNDQLSDMTIELGLTEAFLLYTRHLLQGRIAPQSVHAYWNMPARTVDPDYLLHLLPQSPLQVVIDRFKPSHGEYIDLRNALAAYREIAAEGGWPVIDEGEDLKEGIADARICALRRRLQRTCDLPETRSDTLLVFDKALERAVKVFQRRHGLPADGVVDEATRVAMNVPVEDRIRQIELNMERWRWMPAQLGNPHLRVNLPEGNWRMMTMRVVTGKERTPTELFAARIEKVVVSPYWYVPANIARYEILPHLQANPGYLEAHDMEVRYQGKTIRSDTIRWDAMTPETMEYILRQKPGAGNPLGELKFAMPNPLNIGLHGSPETDLFDTATRAYSHGCIRLENPERLALYALRDTSWTEERLHEIIDYGVEYAIEVPDMPIYFLYQTAWVDHLGMVHFRDDIYGYDSALDAAMNWRPVDSYGPVV